MTDTSLVVSEIFGPTIQGEGPDAGRNATFIRLGGCNLACSWCDTPYTWDASRHDLRRELRRMTVEDVIRAVGDAARVVITGGEPLLQAAALTPLIEQLAIFRGVKIEVETNGTLLPPPWAHGVTWNVSPKLANAGPQLREPDVWTWVQEGARFKFVVTGMTDLAEIERYGIHPDRVWIMPEGTTPERVLDVARQIADNVIARGWNLTLRTHVLLWGAERGR